MIKVSLLLLNTGFAFAKESHVLSGGRHETVRLPALAALIRHPSEGWLLFDTGYAPRVRSASSRFPFSIYQKVSPFDAPPELAVIDQLNGLNLTREHIGTVILSHFHPDHVGGLKDFPDARLVVTLAGYEDTRWRRGWWALSRAVLPDLLPVDLADRATLLSQTDFNHSEPGLPHSHDLFGDGSLRLVLLPGHAVGQVGLLAETEQGPAFLVADAAYLTRSIRENRPPHPATALFSESRAATLRTLSFLNAFRKAHPNLTFLPAHCPEAATGPFGYSGHK